MCRVKGLQSYLTLCDPVDCSPPGSSVHGDSPGENIGVGCHALLQGGSSSVSQTVKNLPAMQERSGRSPEEVNGNPLQYSYLENSMDRGAWQATVCGVEKSRT